MRIRGHGQRNCGGRLGDCDIGTFVLVIILAGIMGLLDFCLGEIVLTLIFLIIVIRVISVSA